MSATYRTCKHIYDTGGTCASASVNGQHYCVYHLHHRARLMRMAQYRARNQRLVFRLPPLENMYAVHSALNQLTEAAGAGMIDLKQARFLLSVVRAAGQFLLHTDKWQADPYHSVQPAPEIDLVKEYGLPPGLDLSRSPEEVFPPQASADLLTRAEGSAVEGPALSLSKGPASSGRWRPATADSPLPHSGNYCADHHSRECECLRIRSDYPVTPEMVEVVEVNETYGPDAAAARSKQLQRNSERRRLNRERRRYEAIALEHNIRRAAERIAEQKLAAHAGELNVAGPQLPDSGNCANSTPPSVTGLSLSSAPPKKPSSSVEAVAELTSAEARTTA